MSLGFPIRPSRSALGPDPENRRKTVNPKQEMDARIARLIFWQVSGAGLMVPMARIFVPIVAGAVDANNVTHAEAWNPNQDQAPPTPTRTGLGVYQVQYAETYPDMDGDAQTTALEYGIPTPQGLGASGQPCIATITKTDGRTFVIKTWRKDTMAADDCSFACAFW